MRKLQILKALVDFIWIVTCIPGLILLLLFVLFVFFRPDYLSVHFDIGNSGANFSDIEVRAMILLFIVLAVISIYCFYLFRKTIRYFQRIKPFHLDVIQNFYKIGYLLIGVGIAGSVLTIVSRLVFKGEFKINLGLTPYLILVCLGLFFMVLSEVFKVAKHAKEENDLTV